jgi:prolyl oligopeptidase PreP (S9A serine peptidase family)
MVFMWHVCRYYYYHNSGLQQQYVLFGQDSLQAEPVCLLDPNTLSEDGTVALKDATFSDDGKLMAYSLSSGGSDWATIKVGSANSKLFENSDFTQIPGTATQGEWKGGRMQSPFVEECTKGKLGMVYRIHCDRV